MSTDRKVKKRCAKCADNTKTSGLFMCDGCQKMFCIEHVNQHREELNHQLELIVYEHDSIKQQLSQPYSDHILMKTINDWERKSIGKIQTAAQKARNDLQKLNESTNQRLTKVCHTISANLCSARKENSFSEIDLEEWKTKLNTIKSEIDSAISYSFARDKRSAIYLIKIESNIDLDNNINIEASQTNDKFGLTHGPVYLDESEKYSTHLGCDEEYGRIRGQNKYSRGRSMIKFKIKESNCPRNLFFGITTTNADLDQRVWSASATVGWSGNNTVWKHGALHDVKTISRNDEFQMDDTLQLILDCDREQVELYNERTDKRDIQHVDLTQTPFPWHFLIGLRSDGDRVAIV